jgi:hypothetical protein
MKTSTLTRCALLVTILLFLNLPIRADVDPNLLKLGVKVYAAIKKVKGGVADLKKVEEVVKEIEAGRTPSVTSNQWADLAKKYKDAAKEIKDSPLPTDFDRSKYAVSLEQLTNCDTREEGLTKIKGYLKELQEARTRGEKAVADLDDSLSDAERSRVALKYLIDVHEKLINVPIYGSIFQWDWFELNTDVSASLGDLTSALKAQKKKINEEIGKLSLYIPNLQGNLSQLEGLSCSLVGHWKGTASGNGMNLPMAILVTQNNGQWEGQINLNDMGDSFRNTQVQGRSIKFTVGQPQTAFTFNGTMSQNGTTLSGTFSSPVVSGNFSLARQPF